MRGRWGTIRFWLRSGSFVASPVLQLLYPELPEKRSATQKQYNLIHTRHVAGEMAEALAKTFNISNARVHQIVHRRNYWPGATGIELGNVWQLHRADWIVPIR